MKHLLTVLFLYCYIILYILLYILLYYIILYCYPFLQESPTCLKFACRSPHYLGVGSASGSVNIWNIKSQTKKKVFAVSLEVLLLCVNLMNDIYLSVLVSSALPQQHNSSKGWPWQKSPVFCVRSLLLSPSKPSLANSLFLMFIHSVELFHWGCPPGAFSPQFCLHALFRKSLSFMPALDEILVNTYPAYMYLLTSIPEDGATLNDQEKAQRIKRKLKHNVILI